MSDWDYGLGTRRVDSLLYLDNLLSFRELPVSRSQNLVTIESIICQRPRIFKAFRCGCLNLEGVYKIVSEPRTPPVPSGRVEREPMTMSISFPTEEQLITPWLISPTDGVTFPDIVTESLMDDEDDGETHLQVTLICEDEDGNRACYTDPHSTNITIGAWIPSDPQTSMLVPFHQRQRGGPCSVLGLYMHIHTPLPIHHRSVNPNSRHSGYASTPVGLSLLAIRYEIGERVSTARLTRCRGTRLWICSALILADWQFQKDWHLHDRGERMAQDDSPGAVWMVGGGGICFREAWALSIGISQAIYKELQTMPDHEYDTRPISRHTDTSTTVEYYIQTHIRYIKTRFRCSRMLSFSSAFEKLIAKLLALLEKQQRKSARQPGLEARIPLSHRHA
ncbi:hypothetical protein Tco_1032146 [Tanacetum coccineum]|uniref:Uncharacterized protein n=1 Tax=Tanacetum coccineum TaxID=301880 RepID=A0ABQ5GAZ8_9ASTR